MPKATKTNTKNQIQVALEELAKLYKSRVRADKKLEKDLSPFKAKLAKAQEVYTASTEDIVASHNNKRSKPNAKISALEKEIEALLLSSRDKNNEPTLKLVITDSHKAEAIVKSNTRSINAEKFLTKFKSTAGIYDCVNILLGKADKLLGKKAVDEVADTNKTWGIEIKEI